MQKYRKPPIIERALIVHANLTEERFQLAAEKWQSVISKEFPHAQTVTEWMLSVTERDGMPVLDTARQTMTIRQTFWKKVGEQKDIGIQVWPDKIAFNLVGAPGNPRHFEELESLSTEWLPRWTDHFGIPNFTGVTLQYVNLLSEATLPSFYTEGSLNIGKALKLFHTIPGPYQMLIPPFDFQINVQAKKEPPTNLAIHCTTLEGGKTASLHLRFTATTQLDPKRTISFQDASKETHLLHDIILSEFNELFTEDAKDSFEPYAYA